MPHEASKITNKLGQDIVDRRSRTESFMRGVESLLYESRLLADLKRGRPARQIHRSQQDSAARRKELTPL